MARGGLVNSGGTCVAVITAASGLVVQYVQQADGTWLSFIPDAYANVGDHWTGSAWLYSSSVAPGVTINQIKAAFTQAGFLSQLTTQIAALTGTALNAWNNSLVASDATIAAAATAAGLTTQQLKSLLQFAATLPP